MRVFPFAPLLVLWSYILLLVACLRPDRTTAAVIHSSSRRNQPTAAVLTPKVVSAAWLDGLKNGLASAMAAACVKTSLQPIDAIKTLQQYHQSTGSSLTVIEAFNEILARPGGFWNFYSGLGVTLVGSMPSVALYFGVYSYCKKHFLNSRLGKKYPTASIALSAAIGNSVASFSRVPYEVMKQKLQTQVYASTWEALLDMTSSRQKFWNLMFPKGGIAIQMIRDVPYAVCTLLLYESLQTAFHKSRSNQAIDFVLGGVAGGFGSWVTNPMDVVKTRLQTDSDLYGGSVWACTREVWLEGGAPAFLRGAVPRLMHKIPANSFFFLFYEVFRRMLGVEDAKIKPKATK